MVGITPFDPGTLLLFYVKLLYIEVCQLICCLPQDFIFGNRCVYIFDLHTKVVVLLIEPKYNWEVFLFDISLLAVSKRFLQLYSVIIEENQVYMYIGGNRGLHISQIHVRIPVHVLDD